MGILKSLPMDFVVTNALLVVTPLEAMAETSAADQYSFKKASKDRIICTHFKLCSVGASKIAGNEVIVDPRKQDLVSCLKNGKNFLRNQDPDKAFLEFKAALELSQTIKNPIEEKKAARGLGASSQRQGKYREAINYHSMVLSISEREGEDSGNTEAFGAIADCYTELGDLDQAATFYDRYISRLQAE
ncbi:hypothetical protein L6452_33358 [Arctium lappa]|uniref:Uncharacterized protein n=1 Tax=Arctium lappa TaxID=4217 RepID=A0ACB8YFT4_ARCLA|nr:hypothetical protein L6452_33358 [Arctium lappa]